MDEETKDNAESTTAVITEEKAEPKGGNGQKKDVEPIISARNLDFIYNPGKTNEFHALKDISFDIYPEEYIVIFGPSGCGKSTLLNVMAGLETPDKGTITVLGRDLTKMSAYDFAMYHRTQIGMIYQAYNLITSLTVLENVVLPQIFVNVSRKKRNDWGRELLKRFGIAEHGDKIPTELSGGQQQRIGIARSIVNNPQIILADEPMGNLDSSSANIALEIIADLNRYEKKTIVMVTHNPEHLDYADRILYMKDGVITKEVINRDKHGRSKELEKPKSPAHEINELMRAYQGMSPEQINILIMPFKSKIFVQHFTSSITVEETKIFEEAVQRRLLGTLSKEDFFEILDRPSAKGGVGLDRRTVSRIVRRINRIVRMAYFAYQKGHQKKEEDGKHKKVGNLEKSARILTYLLKTCYREHYHNLSPDQLEILKEAVRSRLAGETDKAGFYAFLDKPPHEGGAGLNAKTAKAMTEELELILIIGFGFVGMNKNPSAGPGQKKANEYTPRVAAVAQALVPESGQIVHEIARPGDILNQMKEQLSQEVKKVGGAEAANAAGMAAEKSERNEPSAEPEIKLE